MEDVLKGILMIMALRGIKALSHTRRVQGLEVRRSFTMSMGIPWVTAVLASDTELLIFICTLGFLVITRSLFLPGKEVEETHSAAAATTGVVAFRARVACRIDVRSILNAFTGFSCVKYEHKQWNYSICVIWVYYMLLVSGDGLYVLMELN